MKDLNKFIEEAQKLKMKELWNNKEDEFWDNFEPAN